MFCTVVLSEKNGLAKIVNDEGHEVIVEYFDSPVPDGRNRVSVPASSIARKRLGKNTRVFTFNPLSDMWRIGRVINDDGEGVEIRLTHKEDVYLPYEHVFVRWKHPIVDPIDFIRCFITETPQYSDARSGFMKSYTSQRGASFGLSSLLSSSIELEAHQVEVVRRVLTDHTQRYLLADEVGLGKTIEAGIVIRQTVLDDMRGHRVLVLVPPNLVDQWRNELIVRFGLLSFIDESVFVLPQVDSEEFRELSSGVTLLVIDEAHHLTSVHTTESDHSFYEKVRNLAYKSERLLLLSATPILRNEDGFLRMLNMLDPVVYKADDIDGFREKISNRQPLAEIVSGLEPSNWHFMESALEDLLIRLPNDPRLAHLTHNLSEILLEIPDENNPVFCNAVRQVRAHITETYRLNRRILRNRRTQVKGLTPERKGVEYWSIEDSSVSSIESVLEDWRINASLAINALAINYALLLEEFYWSALCSLYVDPSSFLSLCHYRRKLIGAEPESTFEGETELLNDIIIKIDANIWMEKRLERLREGIYSLDKSVKAVVFCSGENSANEVFNYLKRTQGDVVRHCCEGQGDERSELDWYRFITDPLVRIIVCDQSSEEGLNLQGGNKVIIHFDLPLQPNRIEQRIGRVDRFGSGNPVYSYVLYDHDSLIQQSWLRILDDAFGVFSRSISSLQYLVESEISSLKSSSIREGLESMDALYSGLVGDSGKVNQELLLINRQDALDQLYIRPEDELDDLFDVDADWNEIKESMMKWIEGTLLFEKVKVPNPGSTKLIDDPFRFHYCPPRDGGGPATLIPLADFIEDFIGAIDFDAPGNRSTRPQSYPYASHRLTAVKRGVRPLRYGSEFIESIWSFSDLDVRGRSYALWRQIKGCLEPGVVRLCLRFDFLVEVDLNQAFEVLNIEGNKSSQTATSFLARRGDALFSPSVVQVWLDEDGDEIQENFVEQYLSLKYNRNGDENYADKNLDVVLLKELRNTLPELLENWSERCDRMRDKAISIVKARSELLDQQRQSLQKAIADDEIRYAQLLTRIQVLDGPESRVEAEQLALEKKINHALHRGISSPSIKVDVVGAVFLSNDKPQ